jgi:hypothetical protein
MRSSTPSQANHLLAIAQLLVLLLQSSLQRHLAASPLAAHQKS